MEAYPELRHMYLESKVIELLSEQFRQYMELQNGTHPLYRALHSEERDRIYQLNLYIDKHITTLFSLRELADQAGISEYYLKKHFKLCYGVSIHQYIHAERMKLAKILLLQEGMNINEVATFLNITETTNFVAAFKKHFGLPPGKFQKQGLLPH
jgi:AraC-like DNA-binding protein